MKYFIVVLILVLLIPINCWSVNWIAGGEKSATAVVGQSNFLNGIPNAGDGSYELKYPDGVCIAGGKLFITDLQNNRVLIYDSIPSSSTAKASWVVGQPSFWTSESYYNGNLVVSADSFFFGEGLPNGSAVYSDGTYLFVADNMNQRVLIYNSIPSKNGAATDIAVGAVDLVTAGSATAAQNRFETPSSVCYDGTNTYIASPNDHRVLIFSGIPSTNANASIVLGQTNWTNSSANQGGSVAANTLNYPTCVYSDGSKIYVADRSNNRVLIWNTISPTSNQPANVVLGQESMTASAVITDSTKYVKRLSSPQGVCVSGGKIFISDTNDHRVMIFNTTSPTSGQPADVVIGQSSLTLLGGINRGGGMATANSLNNPKGITSDGTRLFIADRSNGRVLCFNTIPTSDNANADFVLGQTSLTTIPDYRVDSNGIFLQSPRTTNPIGVDVSGVYYDGAKFFVADQGNARVLIYNSFPVASGKSADVVVGQPDFNGMSSSGSPYGMSLPCGVFSNGTKLFITDWTYNRVLIYNTIPTTNGVAADIVIGQGNMTATSINQGTTITNTSAYAYSLYYPFHTFSDGTRLFIADKTNNRVLIYNKIPTSNNASADVVIGQPNFNSRLSNNGTGDDATTSVNEKSLSNPTCVWSNGTKLFIVDYTNNRVLVYNSIPTSNFVAADVVLGQDAFNESYYNSTGIASSSTPNASGMRSPIACWSDGKKLYVTDRYNNRIMIWNDINSLTSYKACDVVLGQVGFSGRTNGTSNTKFYMPSYLWTDGKKMAIADNGNNRVMIYSYESASVPANFSASAQIDRVKLTWNASLGADGTLAGYDIYRSTSSGTGYSKLNTSTVSSTAVSYEDTTVQKGNTYYYKIKSVDSSALESDFSTETFVAYYLMSTTSLIPAGIGGEITGAYDSMSKIIIPTGVINRPVTYTFKQLLSDEVSSLNIYAGETLITTYDIRAKDSDGVAITRLEAPIIFSFHIKATNSATIDGTAPSNVGQLSRLSISISDAKDNLSIAVYDEKFKKWTKLGGSVTVYPNNQDVIIRAKGTLMGYYAVIVKSAGSSSLDARPNPFTPLGSDTSFREVRFSGIENTNFEEVEIKFWDVSGTLMRKMVIRGGVNETSWDGKDEQGNIVEGGVYIYQIKVGTKVLHKGTVVVAR